MERDRMAAGGAIDTTDAGNQITAHFNTLHNRSEHVEEAILLLGIVTVGLLAWAETARP
jgi:ribose 5-phosphate isomerase